MAYHKSLTLLNISAVSRPMIQIDLSGKVALVTGGSRGIGAATVKALARAGARVALNYRRDKASSAKVISELTKEGCTVSAFQEDVGDFLESDSLVHRVVEKFQTLDIVVGNAGIWEPNPVTHPRTEENWDRTMQFNLKSVFNVCSHAIPFLRESHGNIINIGSTAAQRGEAGYSDYAASKAGVIAYTKSLAMELAPDGIRANCVSPGWILTDMTKEALENPENLEEALKGIPLGKIGKPEDIANGVLFLASDLASHITGTNLNINGGAVRE